MKIKLLFVLLVQVLPLSECFLATPQSPLDIARDSPMIQKLPGFMGIMGSDNMVNPLTHRIYVSSRMGLKEGTGLALADKRLAVDIGDIPILQQLQRVGIGGILGLDVLRRCSVVRVQCRGNKPSLCLYQVPTKD